MSKWKSKENLRSKMKQVSKWNTRKFPEHQN